MTTLRPLNNSVLFSFLDQTTGDKGKFVERSRGSIIIPVLDSAQNSTHRWVEVVAVGPKAEGVQPGDYALVEALQWTFGSEFEGKKIWRTIDTKIIVVTNDLSATLTY